MERTNYFPTMMYLLDIEDHLEMNKTLTSLVYAERERNPLGDNRSNTAQLGSWHSHSALQKQPEYAELLARIDFATRQISGELGYATDHILKVNLMWAIINPPGNSNRVHIHPGCLWSGVYYIQAPEACGDIEFIDSRTAQIMNPVRYRPDRQMPRDCWPKVNYTPKPGRMIIFPSWLYHGVFPNMSQADRVVISFNIVQVASEPATQAIIIGR